ncbi:MAG: class II fumarate hydratase [Sphingomonadaceae bacterium]|nr:class II fumarate hydratase [Sphingomonadaceae bacterium]
MTAVRQESDSFGPIDVPADAYWGAQTQRSLHHFPFGHAERMPIAIIHALARVKQAAARVNRRHGLDTTIADAIESAAEEVAEGRFDEQFPLSIWQTGSGTQSNMNVNEVVAGRANERLTGVRGGKSPVHPNDHVNRSQSSNDSFPTAIHIAASLAVQQRLFPALVRLTDALNQKAGDWADIVKIGRTHLQDATPLTLGQEVSGWANQLYRCRRRIEPAVTHGVQRLAQGGTAVGTGLNAPPGFAADFCAALSAILATPFSPCENAFEGLASNDPIVHLSGTLATLAVALHKIANDIRLLGSGPRAGLGELLLPENEPGSSIMPGKVNPTQCEMLTMVATQVIANHQAISIGGMQGQLELNVYKPMIGANLLRSIDLLATGMAAFHDHCIAGLAPDHAHIARHVENSLMLVTALAPAIGYDAAAAIAKKAHASGRSLREVALESGVTTADFDRLVVPIDMTRGG